jgi:hypothetical protein
VQCIGEVEVVPDQRQRRLHSGRVSQRTCSSATNAESASTIVRGDKLYRLRNTHSVSRITVFARKIVSAMNSRRATSVRAGSSPVSNRTTTLVSTATTAPSQPGNNGRIHLFERARAARDTQASDHILQPTVRSGFQRPEQNAVAQRFDRELCAGSHRCATRTDFGRMTCPLDDSRVVCMTFK